MQYALVVERTSDGCGYTDLHFLKATTLEAARQEAQECLVPPESDPDDDTLIRYMIDELETAHLVQVLEKLPVSKWKEEYQQRIEALETAEIEAEERKTLAELQAKYGGKG